MSCAILDQVQSYFDPDKTGDFYVLANPLSSQWINSFNTIQVRTQGALPKEKLRQMEIALLLALELLEIHPWQKTAIIQSLFSESLICVLTPAMWEQWKTEEHQRGLNALTEPEKATYAEGLASTTRMADLPFQSRIWHSWLKASESPAIVAVLKVSLDLVQRMLRDVSEPLTPYERKARELASYLKMSADQTHALVTMGEFIGTCHIAFRRFPDLLNTSYYARDLWMVLSGLFGVPAVHLEALFVPSSPMVQAGFFKAVDIEKVTLDNFVQQMTTASFLSLLRSRSSMGSLAEQFFEILPPPTPVPLDQYPHLGTNLQALIQAAQRPLRVLLWGPPGTGKTSLAFALAKEAGATMIGPVQTDRHMGATEDDLVLTQLGKLRFTRKVAPIFTQAPMLLVDECEPFLKAKKHKGEVNAYLDQHTLSEIWIANDMGDTHEAFLRRFDLIVHVPGMPLNHRQTLANQLFKSPNLALRVAQACGTPADIHRAHSWFSLHPEAAWESISGQLSQTHRAKLASQKGSDWHPQVISPTPGEPGLSAVAGYEDLKAKVSRLTRILADPHRFQALRAKVPNGFILAGPPGTGKTHLVRALAQELSVPLVVGDASELAKVPDRIGMVFAEARRLAPCMVFLDEVDVLGSTPEGPQGVDTGKQIILNRLLVELSGFTALDGVLVMAATHRPQVLDSALTRSGRLGTPILIHAPRRADREAIWHHYLGEHPCERINVARLAEASGGMSAADIAQAVNDATMETALHNEPALSETRVTDAMNTVFWGMADNGQPLADAQKWRTAVHEAGHLMLAWKHGKPVARATVRPRASFLGAIQLQPDETDVGFEQSADVGAMVEITLGGLLSEQIVLGQTHSQGVAQDLQQAHHLARQRLRSWGMGQTLRHRSLGAMEPLSNDLLRALEQEESDWMGQTEAAARSWLSEHQAVLTALAETLLERREMEAEELDAWRRCHLPAAVTLPRSYAPMEALAAQDRPTLAPKEISQRP